MCEKKKKMDEEEYTVDCKTYLVKSQSGSHVHRLLVRPYTSVEHLYISRIHGCSQINSPALSVSLFHLLIGSLGFETMAVQ